ncbi:MAG: hypothetical protein U0525_06415 [Patescibacteria group bacterium]
MNIDANSTQIMEQNDNLYDDKSICAEILTLEKYRPCPNCNEKSIKGMRGGPDSTCKNCGYKDPCCFD